MTTVVIDRIRGNLDVGEIIGRSPVANVFGASRRLIDAIRASEPAWIGRVDGEIACVWGLVPPTLLSGQAYLWLLTTEKISEHQFLFVRYSQLMVEDMLKNFNILVGSCNINQPKSIRWLKWLGAKFGEPYGEWVPFQIRRKDG